MDCASMADVSGSNGAVGAGSPVCILGMHRAGTSMVSRLMHDCGLELGDEQDLMPPSEEDNSQGYWENLKFVEINNELLAAYGGTWNSLPKLPNGWTADKRLEPIRERARSLVSEFAGKGHWGWKDPRMCVTLEFWRELVPDMRVVLCVRAPEIVAQSFAIRTVSQASRSEAFALWRDYYNSALRALGGTRFVTTHYVSYFYDAEQELERVLDSAGMAGANGHVAEAVRTIDPKLWRGVPMPDEDRIRLVPPDVLELYERLREMGGPVMAKLMRDVAFQEKLQKASYRKLLDRVERLERINLEQAEEIARLTRASGRKAKLKAALGLGSSAEERKAAFSSLWGGIARRVSRRP